MVKIQGRIQERGKITPLEAIKHYFTGIIDFGGRSTRASFWWVTLFLLITYFIVAGIVGLGGIITVTHLTNQFDERLFLLMPQSEISSMMLESLFHIGLIAMVIIGVLVVLSIVLFIAYLALRARRYRDVGLKTPFIAMWMILLAALSWVSFEGYETWILVFLFIFNVLDLVLYLLPSAQLSVPQASWMSIFIMSHEEKQSLLEMEDYADKTNKDEPVVTYSNDVKEVKNKDTHESNEDSQEMNEKTDTNSLKTDLTETDHEEITKHNQNQDIDSTDSMETQEHKDDVTQK